MLGAGGTGTTAGAAGTASRAGLFFHTGVTTAIGVSTGQRQTIADAIAGDGGLSETGTGTWIVSGANTEAGAGVASLVVAGSDTHSLRRNLGARWQLSALAPARWALALARRALTPELRGSWLHELLDTSSIINAQLAGAGGAGFAANELDLGRDWEIVGGGLAARPSDRWEVRADYNTQFNDRTVFHVGSGALAYSW